MNIALLIGSKYDLLVYGGRDQYSGVFHTYTGVLVVRPVYGLTGTHFAGQ